MKFETELFNKYIWKCCLQNSSHLVMASLWENKLYIELDTINKKHQLVNVVQSKHYYTYMPFLFTVSNDVTTWSGGLSLLNPINQSVHFYLWCSCNKTCDFLWKWPYLVHCCQWVIGGLSLPSATLGWHQYIGSWVGGRQEKHNEVLILGTIKPRHQTVCCQEYINVNLCL